MYFTTFNLETGNQMLMKTHCWYFIICPVCLCDSDKGGREEGEWLEGVCVGGGEEWGRELSPPPRSGARIPPKSRVWTTCVCVSSIQLSGVPASP